MDGVAELTANGPPMACQGAFGSWGECSAPCGGGTATRAFGVTRVALNGGADCEHKHDDQETMACNAAPCPVACAGNWSEWGNCTKACGGGGLRARTFAISVVSP